MAHLEIVSLDWQVNQTVDAQTLAGWEGQTGYKLPEDYRQFLLQFNGGVVRPWILKHNHPGMDPDDHEVILDYLHSWDAVLKYSELNIARDKITQPPDHLLIGQDPGGDGILLCLDEANYGRVVYWQRMHLPWGEDPNHVVGFIAATFTEFLESLFVDEEETDHGYWDVLLRKRAAKPLNL